MTEGRQSSRSISMLHSMLNRVKSSDRPQVSSHVTAEYHGYSKDTNLSDSVFIPESDKPAWKVTGSHLSENSVKPDVDSEYFTQRSVFQESSSTSNTFLKSGRPSNLLHSLTRDTRQDSQLNETNSLWEEVKEEQTSQAESHFSILKSNPPHGPFTHDPTRPSLSHSEPRFIKGPTVPMDYEIMTQPYRSENREAEPPPLPPKLRNLNKAHVPLQRTFTLRDFKLDLEPINLLEEICKGEEWARFLPVKDSLPQTDATDYSQTEDSHHSEDDIGSQYAVIKPDLSADREQTEIGSSPVSITDSQVDRLIQVRQGTSDSPIYSLPKTPIRKVTVTHTESDVPEYEPFKVDRNDLVVSYVSDKGLTKGKNMPLDLSVVQSSGVLDSSALKSRIQLSKKRKHRPPGKRKKGNTKMGFLYQRSTSTKPFESTTSSHTSVFPSSKFYAVPCLESSDSLTHKTFQQAALDNEKALVINPAVLQRISEVPECYGNDNDLDFSVMKSSGVLDNSALKSRIHLGKKRKHRAPGKRKKENGKMKFSMMNFIHQRSASTESVQSHPSSYPSAFTSSAFYNIPQSYDSKDSHTLVPVNEKEKAKDISLKPKLWKRKI